MRGSVHIFVKSGNGVIGYRNDFGYGTTPIERLGQLFVHMERLGNAEYAKLFSGKEESVNRLFLSSDFKNGTQLNLIRFDDDEVANPTPEYLDTTDTILFIDASGKKLRYVFVRLSDFKLENAFDYLVDYMLEVKKENEKADIAVMLRSVASIPVMGPKEIKESYPELYWEMLNAEHATQQPDTKRQIEKLKEEGTIEPFIGYDYLNNRFYHRKPMSADRFSETTIERKALAELNDVPIDFWALQRTDFDIDRSGVVWMRTENPYIRNFTAFLTGRIEDGYKELQLSLTRKELV